MSTRICASWVSSVAFQKWLCFHVFIAFAWLTECTAYISAQAPITALAISPGGDSVVAGSQAGLRTYGWPLLKLDREVQASFSNLHDLQFSPDGRRLAVAGGDPADSGRVEILSWPELSPIRLLASQQDCVSKVQWLSDDELVSCSLDRSVVVWSISDGQSKRVLDGHSRGITASAFLQESGVLVTAGLDQSLRVWKVDTRELLHSLTIHTQPVNALAARPRIDGLGWVASASDDRTVRFWQPTIGRMVRFVRLPARPLDICWLRDGSQILAGCDDGAVYFIDPDSVEITRRQSLMESGWIHSLATDPQSGRTIAGGSQGALMLVPEQ